MEERKEKKGQQEEKIGQALLKVALGYQLAEVTEEYAEVDGALKLTKRKKTKKDIPPDLKAVQLLLAGDGEGGIEELSDEELESEKARLMALLQTESLGQADGEKKTVIDTDGSVDDYDLSEETGKVSFVKAGKVTPISNINELKLLLNTALGEE